ncbi:MAG: hypothetical protein V4850_33645 [Myxococcota bacterium]
MLALALLDTASASDKPPYDKHVSITFSPVHVFLATAEVTGEGRVLDKLGVAGILGVGVPSGVTTVEVGASGRYYVVGSFDHGMQLGAELRYAHASQQRGDILATGDSAVIGPFVGYKIAARFGLSFEAQLGAQHQSTLLTETRGIERATARKARFIPLLNLNLGWSF